jgi:hypothetical protein
MEYRFVGGWKLSGWSQKGASQLGFGGGGPEIERRLAEGEIRNVKF